MEEEEDEKHSEPACPWEAACTAAAFVTPDPPLRLRLLLHRKVMLFGPLRPAVWSRYFHHILN